MEYIFSISGGYLCALSVLFYSFKKITPRWLLLFIWFISFEYLTQIAAIICLVYYEKSSNGIANVHTIIAHSFYLYIFYLAFEKRKLRNLPLFFISILLLVQLFEVLFVRHFIEYANITDNAGRIFLLICCLIYLFQLLMKDEVVNYFKVPMFWITIGILICIIGDWVYIIFYNYLLGKAIDNNGEVNYIMLIITNNFQYLLFTTGFTCNIKWIKVK